MEKKWGELGELQLLHGTPCFVPVDTASSNLSVPVTLHLENVSTWEALKALIRLRQRNCQRRFGVKTIVPIATKGPMNFPSGFDGNNNISIEAKQTPARDVLCNILKLSQLDIGVESWNMHSTVIIPEAEAIWHIMIRFYNGNQPLVATEPYSSERGAYWQKERDEAALPAEACAPEEE